MNEILYKYRDWNDRNHKKILTDGEIYFSSIKEFNDPFDCQLPLRIDLMNSDQRREYIKVVIEKESPNLSGKDVDVEVRLVEKQYDLANKVGVIKYNREIFFERLNKLFGLFALSNTKSSNLMWSHYSNGHKGFCVGFDITILTEKIEEYTLNQRIGLAHLPVQYRRDLPPIDPMIILKQKRPTDMFAYKDIHWSYEEEFRYVISRRASYPMVLGSSIINEIILGVSMNAKDKNEILEIVKNKSHKIDVYEARTTLENFDLKFDKIY